MALKLRVLFTILSALCLVAIVPAAIFGGLVWFGVFGGGALLFFLLMLICKQSHEEQEATNQQEEDEPSFFNPATGNEKDEK